MIKHNIGKGIIWKEDTFCFSFVLRINCFKKVFKDPGCFIISMSGIRKNHFMRNVVFLADIRKSSNTFIGWCLLGNICIDMDQDIGTCLGKKTGCLYTTHIVVCVDTAHILIFTLDRYDWNIIRSKFYGRNCVTQNDHAFNFVCKKFLYIFSFG